MRNTEQNEKVTNIWRYNNCILGIVLERKTREITKLEDQKINIKILDFLHANSYQM